MRTKNMLGWWLGIGLVVILFVNIFSLNYAEQETVTGYSDINLRPVSELISLNPSVSNDIIIPQEDKICGNYEVKLDVNKYVLYEHDKLIIQGNAPAGAKLEGRLIPLDGVTTGKMANVPLKGSNFEYPLHQYGSDDKELQYAAVITALKETSDGNTCLLADFEIVQYKGARINAASKVQNIADTLTMTDAITLSVYT